MKRRDLKVLWSSNSPWSNSGYARFTDDFSQRVHNDGWDIRLVAWAGLAGGMVEYKGIQNYPQLEDIWGVDGLLMHGNHFKANVRFSMQDVHAMNPQFLQQMPNWIPYVPIDREEVQQAVLENLKFANRIITFSKFGQQALARKGFASTMIPEGVDTSVFKPIDKMKAREELRWPLDKIIIGAIGANKDQQLPRKSWQQSLEAFKAFNEIHPDSLLFHQFNQGGGFDIAGYAKYLGILDKIIGFDMYDSVIHGSAEKMNKWLNACDFMLHPSSTEGFGLVITESQAAGTPVVIQDCMSMPELIVEGKTGYSCGTQVKLWAGSGYVHIPDVPSLVNAMEQAYLLTLNESKITNDCKSWIKENYDLDKIYVKQWLPYLEKLQNELLPIDTSVKK